MSEELEKDLPLSRTKQKQQAKAVEQLAMQLASMPDKAFKRLTLSADVAAEALEARATKGHSSLKRQIKHLAGLLRRSDEEWQAVQAQLQGLDQVSRTEKKEFHQLEKLRDRLCEEKTFAAALAEMTETFPQADEKAIARLAGSVHQHGDKRAYREIFKRLRDCLE